MRTERPIIVLLNMPVVGLERPSIALGTLKAILDREGIAARALYANLYWAGTVGLEHQRGVESHHLQMLGEWLFAGKAFDGFTGQPESYLHRLIQRSQPLRASEEREMLSRLCRLRDSSEVFVDRMAERVVAMQPLAVGCSSVFQQHVASLAVLRRIHETAPHIVTLLGGSNCETVMGRSTHMHFEWVDYVVSGEADELIVPLMRAILAHGRELDAGEVPYGVFAPVHRTAGYPACAESSDGAPRAVVRNFGCGIVPDYYDYFTDLAASGIEDRVHPTLPIETSRGCWWGQKHLCSFCGLNGAGIGFRSKQPGAVLAEMDTLAGRHRLERFESVDNILDLGFLKTLLPALVERKASYRLFFETKSNLRREQVRLLADAGVNMIQPGVESLHTRVLKLISKGVSGAVNLQLLKWCREFGVCATWNLIYDFPGEDDGWYLEMAEWLPLVEHLQPPAAAVKVQFHRYSAYHEAPERWHLDLVAAPHFQYVYPLAEEQLSDLVYYFVDRSTPSPDGSLDRPNCAPSTALTGERAVDRPGLRAVTEQVERWKVAFGSAGRPALNMNVGEDAIEIRDTRAMAIAERVILAGLERDVYLACEEGQGERALLEQVARRGGDSPVEAREVIANLLSRGLMLRLDDVLISLAVRAPMRSLARRSALPLGEVDWPEPKPARRRIRSNVISYS